MAERFGDDVYVSATQELLARNHRAMKSLLERWPWPRNRSALKITSATTARAMALYKIRCTMWRDGDRVILDFEGN